MRNIKTEPRECIGCGQTYDWNVRNIYGYCVPCRKKHYIKIYSAKHKMDEDQYKKPYPLNPNDKKKRYRRIAKELNETQTAAERRAIYSREIDYMIETGIWHWCNDIRFSNKIIDKGSGKRGRKPLVNKEIPNTKDWNEI